MIETFPLLPQLASILSSPPESAAADPVPAVQPLFVHKIPAGFPSPAADYLEDGLDLNSYLVQRKSSSYFFTVEGDSMTGVGILPGDKVLVDRSIEPRDGHLVVAVLGNDYTLKRLVRSAGRWALRAENPAYPPIFIHDGEDLTVWGVVVGVVRKVNP